MKMTASADAPAGGGAPQRHGEAVKSYQATDATNLRAEPTADGFEGDVKVSNRLLTTADLKKVADLGVLDADGQSQPFQNIHSGGGAARRVLVIFVRHFFCGNCQEYLRTLSSSVSSETLHALPTSAQIVVIGCGHPDLISMYRQTTACPFPIYADPTRKLYDLLGMTRTLDLGPKSPEYMQKSLLSAIIASFVQSLRSGWGATKGGDYRQVGGEFLFEDGKVTWGHRMRNTRDHAEIPELRKVLGLDDTRPPMRKRWTSSMGTALSNRRQSWPRSRSRTRKGRGSQESSAMEEVAEGVKTYANGAVAKDTPLGTVGNHVTTVADTNGSITASRGSLVVS